MAIDKPTKPTDLVPRTFGGEKNNFSDDLIANGYEVNTPQTYNGDNLNYQLDATGKELDYCEKVVDYINGLGVGKTPIVNANNKLDETQVGLKVYNATETFGLGEWVKGAVNNVVGLYESLKPANSGNALTDATSWKEVKFGVALENKITNCILEAPNGVATYTSSTITVKQGLKVLIPNGKNADGTLKNIEYTLESDYNHNPYIGSENRLLFIDSNGVAFSYNKLHVTTSNHNPSTISATKGLWYRPSENKWFETGDSGATWSEKQICYISQFSTNSTSIISLNNESTVELFKRQDRNEISGLSMPSNRYIDLTLGEDGTSYTAPVNGYFSVGGNFGNVNGYFILALRDSATGTGQALLSSEVKANSGDYGCFCWVPVKKGDKVFAFYNYSPFSNTTSGTPFFRFISAEGEV